MRSHSVSESGSTASRPPEPRPSRLPDMLTSEEIEQLRRGDIEASDFAREAFADLRPEARDRPAGT